MCDEAADVLWRIFMRYYHYGTKRHENVLKGSGMPLSEQADVYNEKGQFSIMGTECALRTLYVTAKKADIG